MSDSLRIAAERMAADLGDNAVYVTDEDGAPDGLRAPAVVVRPDSAEQVSEVIKIAKDLRVGVVPVGGDTSPRRSSEPDRPCLALSLEHMTSLVEHATEDLVFTAQAGMGLKAAQDLVAEQGHRVPLAPPLASRATLGGIVACAAEGATRNAYGAVRDQVLGLQVVHGDGRITRAGGRVVKNVTGYDLCRLYTGSRGVLGVITEVTLRLHPLEASACRLAWGFRDIGQAWQSGMRLRDAVPGLYGIHALTGDAVVKDGQVEAEALLVATVRGPDVLVEALGEACWEVDLPASGRAVLPPDAVPAINEPTLGRGAWLRVSALPADGGRLLELLGRHADAKADMVMDVTGGVCDITHGSPEFLDPVEETALGVDLEPLGAQVDRPLDPEFHLRRFELFPSTRPDGLEIMSALMDSLNPGRTLNQGRHEVRP